MDARRFGLGLLLRVHVGRHSLFQAHRRLDTPSREIAREKPGRNRLSFLCTSAGANLSPLHSFASGGPPIRCLSGAQIGRRPISSRMTFAALLEDLRNEGDSGFDSLCGIAGVLAWAEHVLFQQP